MVCEWGIDKSAFWYKNKMLEISQSHPNKIPRATSISFPTRPAFLKHPWELIYAWKTDNCLMTIMAPIYTVTDYSIVNLWQKWLDWFWNWSLFAVHCFEWPFQQGQRGFGHTHKCPLHEQEGSHWVARISEWPELLPVTIITGTSLNSSLTNLWTEIGSVLMYRNHFKICIRILTMNDFCVPFSCLLSITDL